MLPSLADCRCIRCDSPRLTWVKRTAATRIVRGAIDCEGCGESYDSIWGVPFFGDFEPEDLPSLIEMASEASHFRREEGVEDNSYSDWEQWLSGYHAAKNRARFVSKLKVRNQQDFSTHLPHRYREWILIRHLMEGLNLGGKSVLDVGAGSGFDSYRWRAIGAQVTALEASPALFFQGREKVPQVRWIGGLSHILPFQDESFDAVFCNAALHHMRDIPGSLREMLRVLKTGGWMITASDPYRADFLDETEELLAFDQNPSVLLGVNERMARFSEFFSFVGEQKDDLDVHVLTHGLSVPYPSFERREPHPFTLQGSLSAAITLQSALWRRGKSPDDILEWDLEKDGGLLSNTSGTIALKVKKKRALQWKHPLQPSPSLKVATFAEWLETEQERMVVAHLARILPERYINMPFLEAPHSRFLLLNGWRSNRAHPGIRQAYRRGRWFFRRSQDQMFLDLEVLLPGRSQGQSAKFEVFVDEVQVFSAQVERGAWIPMILPLPPLAVTESFVVELRVQGAGERFGDNLIWVTKLRLASFGDELKGRKHERDLKEA